MKIDEIEVRGQLKNIDSAGDSVVTAKFIKLFEESELGQEFISKGYTVYDEEIEEQLPDGTCLIRIVYDVGV